MRVFTKQCGNASFFDKIVCKKRFVVYFEIGDFVQEVVVREHQILHRDLGFVIRFNYVRILRDLRETHSKSLAYCPNLFHGNLNPFRNLIVCNVRILDKVLANLKIQVGIRPRNFYKSAIIPKVI